MIESLVANPFGTPWPPVSDKVTPANSVPSSIRLRALSGRSRTWFSLTNPLTTAEVVSIIGASAVTAMVCSTAPTCNEKLSTASWPMFNVKSLRVSR